MRIRVILVGVFIKVLVVFVVMLIIVFSRKFGGVLLVLVRRLNSTV